MFLWSISGTLLLQIGARSGLKLYEIASMIQRRGIYRAISAIGAIIYFIRVIRVILLGLIITITV